MLAFSIPPFLRRLSIKSRVDILGNLDVSRSEKFQANDMPFSGKPSRTEKLNKIRGLELAGKRFPAQAGQENVEIASFAVSVHAKNGHFPG